MRIGLIRHGETDWNTRNLLQGVTDIPLNARGEDQARDAGVLLRGAGWDRIYSSPLGRARRTAELISVGSGIASAGVLPGVIERSFGSFEGRPYWTPDGSRISLDDPSIETVDAVRARTLAALEEIEERHHDESVLVISHGSVIRLLLDTLLVERAPHITNLSLTVLERRAPGPGGASGRLVTQANGYPLPPAATAPNLDESAARRLSATP